MEPSITTCFGSLLEKTAAAVPLPGDKPALVDDGAASTPAVRGDRQRHRDFSGCSKRILAGMKEHPPCTLSS